MLDFDVPPESIGAYCCSQFVVARDVIERRSRQFFSRMYSAVDGTWEDSCWKGVKRSSHCYVFEYIWHIVFAEPHYLPERHLDRRLPILLRLKDGDEATNFAPTSHTLV